MQIINSPAKLLLPGQNITERLEEILSLPWRYLNLHLTLRLISLILSSHSSSLSPHQTSSVKELWLSPESLRQTGRDYHKINPSHPDHFRELVSLSHLKENICFCRIWLWLVVVAQIQFDRTIKWEGDRLGVRGRVIGRMILLQQL